MSLSCRNLSYSYPDASAPTFAGACLSVEPGEIVGIEGDSGSGKTTLLACLAGRLAPAQGTVEANGCRPYVGSAEVNRAYFMHVGMVLQLPEQQLFAATVFDEVAFGPRNMGLAEEDVVGRVEEALRLVGMDVAAVGSTSPFAHSGGERRRIALASMLALRQPYLLLDEPTAGLDPSTRDLLLQSLSHIAKRGVGVVIVSHDTRLLKSACSRVYDMAVWVPSDDARSAEAKTQHALAPIFAFGSYRPGSSCAHRLDPRTKIVCCLLFLLACFIARSAVSLAILSAVSLAMVCASGMGLRRGLRQLRPFMWLMAFVLVFNALFTASGAEFFRVGALCITAGGLRFGIESVVRFALVLMGSSTLMATTSPTELTDGFSLLLRPFGRLGIRVDDAALAVQMTLRFIPTINEEFLRVKAAQEARLADFSASSALARAKAYVPVIVPVFASALRRSETLALAIQNREYGQHPGVSRTCIRAYSLQTIDAVCLLLFLVVLAAAFL